MAPRTDQAWRWATSNAGATVLAQTAAIAVVAGSIGFYAAGQPKQAPQIPKRATKTANRLNDDNDNVDDFDSYSGRGKARGARKNGNAEEDSTKRVRFEGQLESQARPDPAKPVPVAVFWDVDNCAPPTGSSGREIVQRIRKHLGSIHSSNGPEAEDLGPPGPLMSFKAYLELSSAEGVSAAQVNLRSELQGSGVSLIDTPKSGRKDVADKMIIADMMAFALDVAPPARIVLLSGDRDFAYPLSLIRGRGYQVILITPPVGAVPILKASANHVARFRQDVLGLERDSFGRPYDHSTPSKSGYPARSASPGPSSGRSTPTPSNKSQSSIAASGQATPSQAPALTRTPSQTAKEAPSSTTATSLLGPGAPPVPSVFAPLVKVLEDLRASGSVKPLRSKVAINLTAVDKDIYDKAGATSWRDYIAVAEAAGIIVLGSSGKPGTEWVALRTIDPDQRSARPNGTGTSQNQAIPIKPQASATSNATPKAQSQNNTGRVDGGQSKDEAFNFPEEQVLPPPDGFVPLVRAIYIAEERFQRSPPIASHVGECLDELIVAGKTEDPYAMQGIKSMGAYINLAYKQRVARLTPTEKHGVAALQVSPAYSAWLDKLRLQGGKLPVGGHTTSSDPEQSTAASIQRTPIIPTGSSQTDKSKVDQLPSFVDDKSSNTQQSSSKYPAGGSTRTKMLPHKPSGCPIQVMYFPLANALLFQRQWEGEPVGTDKKLYSVMSVHKHAGHLVRTESAWEKFLSDAQREDIIVLEQDPVRGRLIRLAPRLAVGDEGSDVWKTDEEEVTDGASAGSLSPTPLHRKLQPSAPASSSNSFQHNAIARSNSAMNASQEQKSSPEVASTASSLGNPGAPTLEDRLRFKPLMDAMIALNKDGLSNPRRTQVYRRLAEKYPVLAVPKSETPDGDPSAAAAATTWFNERGAGSMSEYCRQAETLGFVTIGEKQARGDVEGKMSKTLQLTERYASLLKK
ncbi:unnamed protein product [Jaminaea pallidilutea]